MVGTETPATRGKTVEEKKVYLHVWAISLPGKLILSVL
jgi:hypothetical protein